MKLAYYIKTVLATVFLVTLVSIPAFPRSSAISSDEPDFAFPAEVSSDSRVKLHKALADGNHVEALRSLMNLVISSELISSESTPTLLNEIDSVSSMLPAPYSGLGYLIEARMLRDIYESDRWNFDRRTVPDNIALDNPLFWDRDIFAARIDSLCSLALNERSEASQVNLKNIESLISFSSPLDSFTVYDFIVYESIRLIQAVGHKNIIPFFSKPSPLLKPVSLLKGLLTLHPDPCEARGTAVYRLFSLLPADERGAFLWKEINYMSSSPCVIPLLSAALSSGCVSLDGIGKSFPIDYVSFYSYIRDLRESTQDADFRKKLSDIIDYMTQQSVYLNFPSKAITNSPVKVNYTVYNNNNFHVLLLNTNGLEHNVAKSQLRDKMSLVASMPVNLSEFVPFAVSDSLFFKVSQPGKYTFLVSSSPDIKGILSNGDYISFTTFEVSDIDAISVDRSFSRSSDSNSRQSPNGCYVVNATNGKPLSGASVVFTDRGWSNKKKATEKKTTDVDGFASTSFKSASGEVTFQGSKAVVNTYSYEQAKAVRNEITKLYAERSVYRPGETVKFFGIHYAVTDTTASLLRDNPVTVFLRDANNQKLDSLNLTSGESGRIFGQFILPSEGLLGSWRLSSLSGSTYFQVADYKVPSLLVTLEKEGAVSDSISFKGSVTSYSGMPFANTKVNYNVNYSPAWFFYRDNSFGEASFSSSVVTDSYGNFNIVLPVGNLDPKDFRGNFSIQASATDEAGETAQSPAVQFCLAESYRINSEIPTIIKAGKESLSFNVSVINMLGLPVVKPVEFIISDSKGKIVMEGDFESPVFKLNPSSLLSGKYKAAFRIKNEENTDSCFSDFILYRSSDLVPPVSSVIWVPEHRYVSSSPNTEIEYGCSYAGQYILCVVSDSKGNEEFSWIVSDGRNARLSVKSPADNEVKYISFYAYRDHKFYQEFVTIVPLSHTEGLEIVTESFRNSLTPGEQEVWNFSLKKGGQPVSGFAFAVLYDKAMDVISPFSWNYHLFSPVFSRSVNLHGSDFYLLSDGYSGRTKGLPSQAFQQFDFQTYGYSLYGRTTRFLMKRSYAANSALSVTDGLDSSSEVGVVTEMAFAEEKPMLTSGAMERSATSDDVALEEEVQEKVLSEEDSLRPIEIPVAFFMPDLVSDADGDISIRFTVPDFNTTWNFRLGAYTPSLSSAGISLSAVAAKRIMVKLHPPRFLRTGDRAVITATVFNNTAEDCQARVIYEIFNPLTGEILESLSSENISLSPSGNKVISIDYLCPDTLTSLGLRVIARTVNASDGEQTVIAVLPSSQPVIQSDPFYLAPGESDFTMEIPNFPDGASVTFKFCDNPLWEVVTALSPIIVPEAESLTSRISALYSNCVGSGILRNNSDLAEGLRLIIEGEAGDSLLISNLQKDNALKTVSLNNTPWVNDDSSETLRLSRLGTLLSDAEATTAINDLWQKILELRNPDGGWSWCKGMKSSRWLTERLLLNIGQLKHSGYLPSLKDLNSVIKQAWRFVEADYVSSFNKIKGNKDSFYLSLLPWLYTESFFPDQHSSAAFSGIKKKALGYISSHWNKLSISNKAMAAQLLWRNGNKSVPKAILESLRQYASFSKTEGAWFDNLDSSAQGVSKLTVSSQVLMAFDEIQPSDSIIDGLRQWLLIQRQAQDWSESYGVTDVIHALLTTGTKWSGNFLAPTVTIGSHTVPSDKVSALTGQIYVNLDARDLDPHEIKIRRSSPSPAWGGVISQFIAPMSEIKADTIPGLALRKEFWKIIESPEGQSAVSATSLSVGDKVRVSVIVDCGRDMDFVAITDERPACLEPSDQLSGYTAVDGVWCYRETRNSATNLFFDFLPRGRHIFSYECRVMEEGVFSAGIATAQCLYSPLLTARSAGATLTVK